MLVNFAPMSILYNVIYAKLVHNDYRISFMQNYAMLILLY